MKLISVRLGFANNSSSSHSVVVVSPQRMPETDDYTPGDFGWSEFTLADPESKLDYFAHALYHQLERAGNPIGASVMLREILNLPEWVPGSGIDHQSLFSMPTEDDGATVNAEFARDFAKWIQSEGVVVLGGNDNSEESHPLAGIGPDANPFGENNPWRAKKDTSTGVWTLFDKNSGNKVRLTFEDGQALEMRPLPKDARDGGPSAASQKAAGEIKSSYPELVDVKITDKCNFGCAYCYQNSTPEGRHADMDDLRRVARELFKAGTFEVAIGGGEPTLHPQFPEILEMFNDLGIAANFTTRSLDFLENPETRKRILEASKSIAVSVNSVGQITAALAAWERTGGNKWSHPFSFQYVMGTASDEEFAKIIAHCAQSHGAKLTLLGFKETGRGAAYLDKIPVRDVKAQNQSASWIGLAKAACGKHGYARFAIDTALARECAAELKAEGVPAHMFHVSEGLVSMYVDAVEMTMAASSYETGAAAPFGADWLARYAAIAPSCATPKARRKP